MKDLYLLVRFLYCASERWEEEVVLILGNIEYIIVRTEGDAGLLNQALIKVSGIACGISYQYLIYLT